MKKLVTSFLIALTLSSCLVNRQGGKKTNAMDLSRLQEKASYHSYLNEIIEIQKSHPIKERKELSIDVVFHKVRPLENTSLYEEDFSATLSYMNTYFKEVGIQFKEKEKPKYLFSSAPVDAFYYSRVLERSFIKRSYDPTVLNIYVVENSKDVVGFTHYPIESLQSLFIAEEKLLDPSFIHEIGHFFGLLHTFETNESLSCEKSGDKICDTPADINGASFVEGDCTLFGTYQDENGQNYEPDLSNFMSYYGKCRSSFSPEQIKRMYFIAKNIKIPQMRTSV